MTDILLFVIIALLAVAGVLLLMFIKKASRADVPLPAALLETFEKMQDRMFLTSCMEGFFFRRS